MEEQVKYQHSGYILHCNIVCNIQILKIYLYVLVYTNVYEL